MTSSLVGSEMCIRDRYSVCPSCAREIGKHCVHGVSGGVQGCDAVFGVVDGAAGGDCPANGLGDGHN
eukprot:11018365-Prorocentrum_lima.AAC.1